jgi:ParB-like chromosome segregation protein Spo0J
MTEIQLLPLSFVRKRHFVRPVSAEYVEKLAAKVGSVGVKPYLLSVTPGGVLFAGNHRYEVFQKLGIKECWMHVVEPGSIDREAIELNVASEGALPMSFVGYAELVWRKLKVGTTQQAIAEELGWSRGAIGNYAQLQKIDGDAWKIVTASAREAPSPSEDEVTASVTAVTF